MFRYGTSSRKEVQFFSATCLATSSYYKLREKLIASYNTEGRRPRCSGRGQTRECYQVSCLRSIHTLGVSFIHLTIVFKAELLWEFFSIFSVVSVDNFTSEKVKLLGRTVKQFLLRSTFSQLEPSCSFTLLNFMLLCVANTAAHTYYWRYCWPVCTWHSSCKLSISPIYGVPADP